MASSGSGTRDGSGARARVRGRRQLEGMARPAAEVRVVLVGDAEEFGDHRRGQRCVKRLDEVDLTGGRHGVDQLVGDPLDARGQFGGAAVRRAVKAAASRRRSRPCYGGSARRLRAQSHRGPVEDVTGGDEGRVHSAALVRAGPVPCGVLARPVWRSGHARGACARRMPLWRRRTQLSLPVGLAPTVVPARSGRADGHSDGACGPSSSSMRKPSQFKPSISVSAETMR